MDTEKKKDAALWIHAAAMIAAGSSVLSFAATVLPGLLVGGQP